MKKQIWEIGGMGSNFPLRIDTLRITTLEEDELYLIFEILEDGQLGFKVPLINYSYLNIYNRISYSKDKKTWIHTDINEPIPVKKGEIWYCKGECSSIGSNSIGSFSGINDLTGIKYNVSGNISSILDIRKENPDAEKIMIEFIECIDEELLKLQSPEEVLVSLAGEEAAPLLINAFKYSDKNKTPAHARRILVLGEYFPDEPDLSDEEFIRHIVSLGASEGNKTMSKLLSKSCITLCLILTQELGYVECSPKLDSLFQSEDVVDASGLVIDYSTTCSRMFLGCHNLTKAPKLPMTTLLPGCYQLMFAECESLTETPELPASILKDDCYRGMFEGCSNIKQVKILANEYDAEYPESCLEIWLPEGVNGTIIKNRDFDLMGNVPNNWIIQNI